MSESKEDLKPTEECDKQETRSQLNHNEVSERLAFYCKVCHRNLVDVHSTCDVCHVKERSRVNILVTILAAAICADWLFWTRKR